MMSGAGGHGTYVVELLLESGVWRRLAARLAGALMRVARRQACASCTPVTVPTQHRRARRRAVIITISSGTSPAAFHRAAR